MSGITWLGCDESSTGTFAVEIPKDLVNQGYQGEQLVVKFEEVNGQVRSAVERMIHEADETGKKMKDDVT